jgi:hypothetical protein
LLVNAQHFGNFVSYIHDSLDIKGLIYSIVLFLKL